MDFKEAMKKRHVVRRYRDEELDLETVSALRKRVEEDNEKYQVHVKLETGGFFGTEFRRKTYF